MCHALTHALYTQNKVPVFISFLNVFLEIEVGMYVIENYLRIPNFGFFFLKSLFLANNFYVYVTEYIIDL